MKEIVILGKTLTYEVVDNCWICTSNKPSKSTGYVSCHFPDYNKDKPTQLHRASYMHHFGEIRKGNVVMHICDNPKCFNPDHLIQGTSRDNTRDMITKGRGAIDGAKRKLTDEDILCIRSSELSSYKLADIYNVSSTHIRRIKNGTRRNPNHKQKQYTPKNYRPADKVQRHPIAVEI